VGEALGLADHVIHKIKYLGKKFNCSYCS